MIFFLTFVYLPTLYSFYLSFFKTKLLSTVNFIGFQNYLKVLKDPVFLVSLRNTFFFTAGSLIAGLVVGLVLALLLERKIPGRTFFRSIFFIPYIIPYTGYTLLWYWILDPVHGLVNYLLNIIGITNIPWYRSPDWVLPAFILMNTWKRMGYVMVLYLVGLTTIPRELHDAADIDGANWWSKLCYITLPLLKPITLYILVITMVYNLQLFIEVFIITRGGPSNASISVVYLLYRKAFYSYNIGESSAITVIFFIIISLFTFFLMKSFLIKNY
jgi:ABC-type sugar transport system permease subunit